ncbi:MAG: hypothetical protein JSV88_04030 [Candidatus Aminicenantes bacterium]|nr:MAG: hypothetical protein JSV88_04030 [Candidatus Aminicenantes bacterium]
MTQNASTLTPGEIFECHVHRIGRITIFTCIVLALFVPVIIWMIFGIIPPLKPLIFGIINVSVFMIPLSIAEIFSFYPILGPSGLYISYTTGNISNLKVPCAAIGMEVANVKPATKEGDIISTIAMAGSVIISELILVLGVILLVPLSGYLEGSFLKPAFEQILPALFGALGAYFVLKNYKLAIIPLAFGLVASLFIDKIEKITSLIPICVILSILGARFLYKKGWVKAD